MKVGLLPWLVLNMTNVDESKSLAIQRVNLVHATWFTIPNHDLIPLIDVGVGNSCIAFVIFNVGLRESRVTVNPAKSTVSLPKTNFSGLNIMPFRAQTSI